MSDKVYHNTLAILATQFNHSIKCWTKTPILLLKTQLKHVAKNPLGRAMIKKLKIYDADKHDHTAQKPTALEYNMHKTYGTGRRKTSSARVYYIAVPVRLK